MKGKHDTSERISEFNICQDASMSRQTIASIKAWIVAVASKKGLSTLDLMI